MEDLTFHIITPYKGDQLLLDECIQSVNMQTLSANHHVVVDHENKGACRNHFETLQTIEPVSSNIIIHLDGDDRLLHTRVLETVRDAYQNSNVWATYGNYVSRSKSVCRPIDRRSFRQSIIDGGWSWSHLRTFRAHLIPHLKEKDMKDSSGRWFSSSSDVAIFLPILELCGKSRVRFIDEDLVYYRIYEGNDHANPDKLRDQVRCAIELFKKEPYKQL